MSKVKELSDSIKEIKISKKAQKIFRPDTFKDVKKFAKESNFTVQAGNTSKDKVVFQMKEFNEKGKMVPRMAIVNGAKEQVTFNIIDGKAIDKIINGIKDFKIKFGLK